MISQRTVEVVIAYSYIRFSNPEQEKGDSLRRQWEMAVAYCQRRGWTLSTATYRDLGVSAFRGKNRLVGRLGEFLKAIESGAVKPGSVLIVESVDRISRQGVDEGYDLIKKILKAGIRIVTLSPEREYDVTATKGLAKGLLDLLCVLERAAEESERRSDRLGHAWAQKKRRARETGEPMTARTPSWLRLIEGEWKVLHDAADTIHRIFRMAAEGYGIGVIAKRFNAERVPVIGRAKKWARSYVAKILSNRAVLGECQPCELEEKMMVNKKTGLEEPKLVRVPDGKPIPGYYPQIVTPEEWAAAKAGIRARKGKAGRPPKTGINLFSGLLRDARDGGTLQLLNKGKKSSGPVLVPYNAVQGIEGSKMVSFPAPVFEKAVLESLHEIKPAEILPQAPTDNRAQVIEAQMDEVSAEIEKLKDRLQARYSDAVADVLEKQEQEQRRLAAELAESRMEEATPLSEAWGKMPSLIDALAAAPDEEEARVRLRAALRRIVEGIWVIFVPGEDRLAVWEAGEENRAEARRRLGERAPPYIPPRPGDRLATVQIWFRGGAYRSYIVMYRPARGGAVGSQPARMYAASVKNPHEIGLSGYSGDLRDRQEAEWAVEFLERFPQDMIDAKLGQPKRKPRRRRSSRPVGRPRKNPNGPLGSRKR